jgi:hypothetical protein
MGDSFRRMARVAVCAVAVVLCAASGIGVTARAQAQGSVPVTKTMLVEPPTPLLPETLGGLHRQANGDAGDGLGLVDASDATVLTEDGLRRFARSDYSATNQKNALPQGSVTVYRFMDASGAVAAYDYFRRGGMRPEKVGDEAISNGDELLLRSGVNVVVGQFKLDHEAMIALTKELIEHLPKVGGPAGIAPQLPELLPAKGLDVESLRYALGMAGYRAMGGVLPAEMVGFEKSAEAVTAKYKGGGVLTLLLYPTPEIAGEHERAIEALSRQGGAPAGTMKMRREGTLLVMTSGTWPEDEAQKMVDGIHLRSEVTWDKPVPLDYQTEVRKTFSLLVSITIFCCLAFLAAIVLALFLGGGRALVRIMQGKPAATEPEFLRIDLSGPTGKRLGGPEA